MALVEPHNEADDEGGCACHMIELRHLALQYAVQVAGSTGDPGTVLSAASMFEKYLSWEDEVPDVELGRAN